MPNILTQGTYNPLSVPVGFSGPSYVFRHADGGGYTSEFLGVTQDGKIYLATVDVPNDVNWTALGTLSGTLDETEIISVASPSLGVVVITWASYPADENDPSVEGYITTVTAHTVTTSAADTERLYRVTASDGEVFALQTNGSEGFVGVITGNAFVATVGLPTIPVTSVTGIYAVGSTLYVVYESMFFTGFVKCAEGGA